MSDRKYAFSWELLGDIDLGRPHLGHLMRLELYRIMQFTFRDVLEQHFGAEMTDELFREAGRIAGKAFAEHYIGSTADFNEFVRKTQEALRELRVGILRVEEADPEQGKFVLSVEEDLDCSGLPELDFETCKYDEGFLASILEWFTGRPYDVREIECWCTGGRACRFAARAVTPSGVCG